MKFTAFCSCFCLCLFLAPTPAFAGNPPTNNEFTKDFGRFRSYTGDRPTHRSITRATKDYRESLSIEWKDYASTLQREAALRRTKRIESKVVTKPFTTRERFRLRRTYRSLSTRRL